MSPVIPRYPPNPQNSLAIANYFVRRAEERGEALGITKLVKLVYLAHGWCLGHDLGPLISTQVQAWKHGPVVPEVYKEFRAQGLSTPCIPVARENGKVYEPNLNAAQQSIMDSVFESYSPLAAFQLSKLTHEKGTPWAQADDEFYAPIDEKSIYDYYKKRVDGAKNK